MMRFTMSSNARNELDLYRLRSLDPINTHSKAILTINGYNCETLRGDFQTKKPFYNVKRLNRLKVFSRFVLFLQCTEIKHAGFHKFCAKCRDFLSHDA